MRRGPQCPFCPPPIGSSKPHGEPPGKDLGSPLSPLFPQQGWGKGENAGREEESGVSTSAPGSE